MMRRLAKDEQGIALPLALIMIVLIGVMGAGLLVFVQTGLRSTLEVNQGQRALKMADAGVQAAKRQLAANATATHYNGSPNPESQWSYSGTGQTLSLGNCNNCINVKIQYLPPATNDSQVRQQAFAPQVTTTPERDFFRIVSEGRTGEARRKIEAIYYTQSRDVPRAYYTPGGVTISGSATIENMSVFSRGIVTINGAPTFLGSDLTYGSWISPFNTTARRSSHPSGPMVTTPGVGTTETITYQGGADSNRLGVRDYAANSPAGTPQFILKNPPDRLQTTSEISFPFDYRNEPDLEDMRLAAQQQGNYYQRAAGTSASITGPGGVGTGPKWPDNSAVDTVVFVRFPLWDSHNSLTWNVSGNCSDAVPMKGTLVVENGTFTAGGQNNARLNGYVIIRGVPVGIESFTATGNCGMEGAVNSSGDIRIAGTVKPFTLEPGNRPGFYGLRRWSWRELFQ